MFFFSSTFTCDIKLKARLSFRDCKLANEGKYAFQIYAVVTSVSEMCNKYVSVQGEGEKEFEVQERGKYLQAHLTCPMCRPVV